MIDAAQRCGTAQPVHRYRVTVRGQVQGVGFRPFVFRLARELAVNGWVCNDGWGVVIDVQGEAPRLQQFLHRLRTEAPPLARISALQSIPAPPLAACRPGFAIRASGSAPAATEIPPDAAVCGDCLRELFSPADRRHRYPFINCTHCGPRFTIARSLPFDRPNTSMADFTLCTHCGQEYADPADRRFHAQANACPRCGPQLWFQRRGRVLARGDGALALLSKDLRAGKIVAMKSLGGFHLICDARNGAAVAELRRRKHRRRKPLAAMALNCASARRWVEFDRESEAALTSVHRPIVLLSKRGACDHELAGLAPELTELGVMLPYTPLHYLMFHEVLGRPQGQQWLEEPHPALFVVTSANPGGEPLATDNHEAVARLGAIADSFLLHNRPVVTACDDSVLRAPAFMIRRARGFAPSALRLGKTVPPVLACGAQLKNTVCATRGDEAFLSQHVGDLTNAASCEAIERACRHLLETLEMLPSVIAHDLHPDFHSTRFAHTLAAELDVATVAIAHHHAHAAAVMAEHGLEREVLAIALDGFGLGHAGELWGGELLRVTPHAFQRLGYLRPLALPGGGRAAREPWRMAAAALHAMGRNAEIERRFGRVPGSRVIAQMLRDGVHCPAASSAGRWFDAAAGMLGVSTFMEYEGEAAMALEAHALRAGKIAAVEDGFTLRGDEQGRRVLDLLPLLAHLAEERDPSRGAALFHATLARAIAEWAGATAESGKLRDVVLAGGCFLNRILARQLPLLLQARGLRVYQPQRVPPNDGGVSLGQAWVAAHRAASGNLDGTD